jgi:signal transduction histidine kinase
LYLESDIVDDAFTEKRAQVMSLLANQIAISLETARFSNLLQSEKNYKQTATQLQKAKKQLEEFIDVLCHELRNPLNSIVGYKDVLSDLCEKIVVHPERYDLYDSQFAEALKYLSIASDNLKEIIDTVLTVSMLENKSVKLQTCGFEPQKIIHDIVNMFDTKSKDGNIELQLVDVPKLLVTGDPYRFKELFINLISSALKVCSCSHFNNSSLLVLEEKLSFFHKL